jgi:hypothetical protein
MVSLNLVDGPSFGRAHGERPSRGCARSPLVLERPVFLLGGRGHPAARHQVRGRSFFVPWRNTGTAGAAPARQSLRGDRITVVVRPCGVLGIGGL